jgi:transketolase
MTTASALPMGLATREAYGQALLEVGTAHKNIIVIDVDGHDVGAVRVALHQARESHDVPVCIIAHTTKGKGVTFMENNNEFHGKSPSSDQLQVALSQLAE